MDNVEECRSGYYCCPKHPPLEIYGIDTLERRLAERDRDLATERAEVELDGYEELSQLDRRELDEEQRILT